MKNIYLTKSEQRVYNIIRKIEGEVITKDEIEDLFPEIDCLKINKICSSLSKKGYLFRIQKSKYLIQFESSKEPILDDPLKIATQIYSGYIGFSSALRIYDLIEYIPFSIFVVTKETSKRIQLGEYTFQYIAIGEKASNSVYYNGYYVSSKEKTFFDCLYKPQYAGGYQEITKALYLNKGCRWDELEKLFAKYGSNSLCQRSGYILSLLDKTDLDVSKKILDFFKGKIKTKTRLIPTKKSTGQYISEWKVMDNLGKENILSWWCHG